MIFTLQCCRHGSKISGCGIRYRSAFRPDPEPDMGHIPNSIRIQLKPFRSGSRISKKRFDCVSHAQRLMWTALILCYNSHALCPLSPMRVYSADDKYVFDELVSGSEKNYERKAYTKSIKCRGQTFLCRRSYRLEFASKRSPRSRLYRKRIQTVAEDIPFRAALVCRAR